MMWIPEWLVAGFYHVLTYVAGLFTREFVKLAAPWIIPKKKETDKIDIQITDGGKRVKDVNFKLHDGSTQSIDPKSITDDTDQKK